MAKSVKALITPEVLKWARERRIKLEIDYAAKKLKVDPERLEAWENGTEQPTIAQLKKIAKLYKTTFPFSICQCRLLVLSDRLQIIGYCPNGLQLMRNKPID